MKKPKPIEPRIEYYGNDRKLDNPFFMAATIIMVIFLIILVLQYYKIELMDDDIKRNRIEFERLDEIYMNLDYRLEEMEVLNEIKRNSTLD